MTNINTRNSVNNNVPAVSLAIGTATAGAGIGAICGAIKKTPVVNTEGIANDTFVKNVYTQYVKKTKDEEVKLFEKQRADIMKKIGNVNSAEDLKKLISENKELFDKILASSGTDAETYCNSLTKGFKRFFVKKSKKNMQRGVENAYEMRLDDLGCKISECWNSASKKFEKSTEISDELFSAIKKTQRGIKLKNVAKTAGIAGLITGAGTFLITKIIGLIKNGKTKTKTNVVPDSLNVSY